MGTLSIGTKDSICLEVGLCGEDPGMVVDELGREVYQYDVRANTALAVVFNFGELYPEASQFCF